MCEACLRDYARQVQDHTPETRHLALELLDALLSCLRLDPEGKAANHLSWALHRLGVDGVASRKALMITRLDGVRWRCSLRLGAARQSATLADELARAFGLDADERTHSVSLDRWPDLVDFAADRGLAIALPTIGAEPVFLTDHLVGAPAPDIRKALRGRLRPGEVRGATLDLEIGGVDQGVLGLLLGSPSTSVIHLGRSLVCSRFVPVWGAAEPARRWIAPLREAELFLEGLGFSWPNKLARVSRLEDLSSEGVRPTSTLLRLGLARLGFVDVGLSTPMFVAHSSARGILAATLEPSGRALLVEHGTCLTRVPCVDTLEALSRVERLL